MRAWDSRRGVLDCVEEAVALRSGILLTDHDAFSLLIGTPMEGWVAALKGDPDQLVGVRPEYVADIIRTLRAAVGNLPDATPAGLRRIRRMMELDARGVDVMPVFEGIGQIMSERLFSAIDAEAIRWLQANTTATAEAIHEALKMLLDEQEREWWIAPQPGPWDGHRPLADLFDCELLPSNEASYLDQRFLDYLAVQGQKIDAIHWRNFERLTAEFFSRAGYQVTLGRGTKDGGVDVRAWTDDKREGPPIVLIQCKRFKKDDLVKVEYVKALWADVHAEEAKFGLIATTARVSPEGKRLAEARKYPLTFAENAAVRQWASSLWRHSWEERQQSEGLGGYALPPIIVPGDSRWDPLSGAADDDD